MSEKTTENDTPTNESEQNTKSENETSGDELVEIDGQEMTKQEAYEQQKGRAERAERALKTLKAKTEKSKTPKKEEKSDEPNVNDRLDNLTLSGAGVDNQKDIDFVKSEATKAGKTVDEILQYEFVKETLKKSKTQREAEDGMPDGSGKKGGGTKDKVSYWVDRKDKDGGYENPPNNPELTIKVVNARMEKERKSQEFPDS